MAQKKGVVRFDHLHLGDDEKVLNHLNMENTSGYTIILKNCARLAFCYCHTRTHTHKSAMKITFCGDFFSFWFLVPCYREK